MKAYLPHLILLLFGGALLLISIRGERRMKAHLAEQMERDRSFFETLDGRHGAETEQLALRTRELEMLLPQLSEQVRRMGVNLKRTEAVQQTAVRTAMQFSVALRDSIGEALGDSLRVFRFRNDFLTLEGRARRDTQWVALAMHDTLLQVVYRGKRTKPWLLFFSPRELLQRVSLSNPNATIRYSRKIVIQKEP